MINTLEHLSIWLQKNILPKTFCYLHSDCSGYTEKAMKETIKLIYTNQNKHIWIYRTRTPRRQTELMAWFIGWAAAIFPRPRSWSIDFWSQWEKNKYLYCIISMRVFSFFFFFALWGVSYLGTLSNPTKGIVYLALLMYLKFTRGCFKCHIWETQFQNTWCVGIFKIKHNKALIWMCTPVVIRAGSSISLN